MSSYENIPGLRNYQNRLLGTIELKVKIIHFKQDKDEEKTLILELPEDYTPACLNDAIKRELHCRGYGDFEILETI